MFCNVLWHKNKEDNSKVSISKISDLICLHWEFVLREFLNERQYDACCIGFLAKVGIGCGEDLDSTQSLNNLLAKYYGK